MHLAGHPIFFFLFFFLALATVTTRTLVVRRETLPVCSKVCWQNLIRTGVMGNLDAIRHLEIDGRWRLSADTSCHVVPDRICDRTLYRKRMTSYFPPCLQTRAQSCKLLLRCKSKFFIQLFCAFPFSRLVNPIKFYFFTCIFVLI